MSTGPEPSPLRADSPLLHTTPSSEETARTVAALKQAHASLEQQVQSLNNRMARIERDVSAQGRKH